MVSVLIRAVMSECKLTQQDLANLMGVPLQRVKRLALGQAKKFASEEIRALVEELHVSADWLATGSGPMFRLPPQEEDQDDFARRMQTINALSAVLDTLPLSQQDKARLKVLLTGDPARDAVVLAQAMGGGLKPDEAALLDNYRHSPPEGKMAIRTTSAALAKPSNDSCRCRNDDQEKSA
ncbi:helix-turn-helix domain-containing protein [Burkholderia glumae]|uniref:helix-turn-helix domain-containing protein n=1 Tax=Burkholderia glumae TaxID=337 RepID=UPI00130410BF|nr:helix-turn-helix transcriptional regulator [Burkholderia glumae]MCM2494564.1 helix-turn-helix domain-containing protein [Burkholderia glumae]